MRRLHASIHKYPARRYEVKKRLCKRRISYLLWNLARVPELYTFQSSTNAAGVCKNFTELCQECQVHIAVGLINKQESSGRLVSMKHCK